jgi:hypothetical protein
MNLRVGDLVLFETEDGPVQGVIIGDSQNQNFGHCFVVETSEGHALAVYREEMIAKQVGLFLKRWKELPR